MKSRIALATVLVAGLLVMDTSASLAVSGISSSGSAGRAQYPASGGAAGGQSLELESAGGEVRAGSQIKADSGDGGSLPFTGVAAIPLILLGVALTATGFVFRRHVRPA